MTDRRLCGNCGYCTLPLVPCVACSVFGFSYNCHVCSGSRQMRQWAYEIGHYPEHDVYNVEASRIVRYYVLHQNSEYLYAKAIYENYDNVLRNNPEASQEEIAEINREYRDAVDVLNRLYRDCNVDGANTCLNGMGRHVRFLMEPSRHEETDQRSDIEDVS